jgi:nitroreductase
MKINKAIKERWSPRAFSEQPITKEIINLLFEAARRAPSARNEQPWQYFFTERKNEKVFNEILGLLTGNNPDWAKESQLFIISVMKKNYDYKNRPNSKALHDIGAANVSIAIQAAELGLQVHQMGGFDKEKTSEYLKLDTENFEPVTIFAVGFPDEKRAQTEDTLQRKKQSESRKEVRDFVFEIK